jgi:glycosyltransferase involved in cell wall biosynthesis
MNVLMVTPHLPPHQSANALLPDMLGQALRERGHGVRFLTFGRGLAAHDDIVYVSRRSPWLRRTRLPQAVEAVETWWKGKDLLRTCDVVHIHSSTWMNQVAAKLAARQGKPYVLTHYGTEIWHHDGRNEVFRQMNREACHVTFYSAALAARARELAVPTQTSSVIYPAVSPAFAPLEAHQKAAIRERYALSENPLLLNVKRLHPLADQATLLEAMARIVAARPNAKLLIAGRGEREASLKALAERLALGSSVRFLGMRPNDEVAALQGVADLFLLTSLLEATPTVALEALACGTPVISTDSPGGVELNEIFGEDVALVPKQDPEALAQKVLAALAEPRRTSDVTAETLRQRFRPEGVASRYLALYEEAVRA